MDGFFLKYKHTHTHTQQRTLFTQLWLHSFGLLMNQTNPALGERTAEQESPASAVHGATQSLGSPATHAAEATRAVGNRPN